MKACPYCEAELRDSVIRCTRCGRSLRGDDAEPVPAASTSSAAAGAPPIREPGAPWATGKTEPWTRPEPEAWTAMQHEARTATERDSETTAEADDQPVTRRERTTPDERTPHSLYDSDDRRALPTERRAAARPDVVLLLSAIVAIVAAFLAWQAVAEPWVRLVITDTSDRLDPVLVGRMSVPAKDALVGNIGQALAAVLGVLGVMWFVFGFDRGWTMPWFANPVIGIGAAVAGLGAVVLSSTVWFVWEDAAVASSRSVGLAREKLQEILNLQPAPLVEISRLPGLVRFGTMMVIGLVVASAAWWASRRRA
jgi:hypothetical protein